jgi:hypothetical protein
VKRTLLLLLLGLPVLLPHAAWAMRCGTHVVQQGDGAAEVRARCGVPFFVDLYQVVTFGGRIAPPTLHYPIMYEAWYYNFGPSQMMVQLLFSHGTLERERTLGYGFSGKPGPCNLDTVGGGMSSGELYARCGAPVQRRGSRGYLPDYEEWLYQGNGGRARIVHLLNGRVQDVKTED